MNVARQSIPGQVPAEQHLQPTIDRGSSAAGHTLATSALGILGCNAAEVFLYNAEFDAYVSVAVSSDSRQIPQSSQLERPAVDAIFPEGIDVLTVVALVAAYLPASRAARLEPVAALRAD